MANISLKKSDASVVYQKATGAGTDADPHVPHHNIDTFAGGASEDLGAKNDSQATSDTGAFSLISLFKRLLGMGRATTGRRGRASGGSRGSASPQPIRAPRPRTSPTRRPRGRSW